MAIALVITFFVKYFNKAMVIFNTDEKNTEKKKGKKIVCTKMMLEKNFLPKKISHTPPLQENNDPSLKTIYNSRLGGQR